jgi:hypothetical protein
MFDNAYIAPTKNVFTFDKDEIAAYLASISVTPVEVPKTTMQDHAYADLQTVPTVDISHQEKPKETNMHDHCKPPEQGPAEIFLTQDLPNYSGPTMLTYQISENETLAEPQHDWLQDWDNALQDLLSDP